MMILAMMMIMILVGAGGGGEKAEGTTGRFRCFSSISSPSTYSWR